MATRIDMLTWFVAGECYFAWPVVDYELRVVWVLAAEVPGPASDEEILRQQKVFLRQDKIVKQLERMKLLR